MDQRIRQQISSIVVESDKELRRVVVDAATKVKMRNPNWPLARCVKTARKSLLKQMRAE